METALESFKNDNGVYPLSTPTRVSDLVWGNSGTIEVSNSGSLYTVLAASNKVYFTFKPDQIRVTMVSGSPVTNIVDSFGAPYNYFRNPALTQSNLVTYDLWSYGPDNKNDTADDIVNWRR